MFLRAETIPRSRLVQHENESATVHVRLLAKLLSEQTKLLTSFQQQAHNSTVAAQAKDRQMTDLLKRFDTLAVECDAVVAECGRLKAQCEATSSDTKTVRTKQMEHNVKLGELRNKLGISKSANESDTPRNSKI